MAVKATLVIGGGMWAFGRVFTWQLWLALVGTAAIIATLFYIFEVDYARRGIGKTKISGSRAGVYEAAYRAFGKLFAAHGGQ